MLKIIEFIGDLKIGRRASRRTPFKSIQSCQKTLILDDFHAFSAG